MGKPVKLTAVFTATTPYSTVFVPDRNINPFNVGFGCVVSGTITYTVQHTFDDPNMVAVPTWFPHTYAAAQTASIDGNYAFPIAGIRVTTTAGTGSVVATFIQSGVAP
ncbi:hypothetical protein UFOVP28_38 [uncultured Caudovirales phage]|uniref:Uncharacterized protein n=1 Tax=uncultured Caudovirales phage TaxID=2100421 RepID=A0A6J5KNG0_9CAUD|nr:hypothetical protein UFOVP28_38 [uncultured Caudovirales phage]